MSNVMMVLFWAWLATSVFIYGRRVLTTGSVKPDPEPGDETSTLAPSRTRKPARPTIDEELAAMAAPAAVGPDPSPAPKVAREERPAPVALADQADAPFARSLADALEGIQMPCQLAPLVATERLDPRNMIFSTSGFPPETVGTSVADELERLGYAFNPVDEHILQARRGGTVVEITVHPDMPAAVEAIGPRVGAAPDDAVLVEFQLR